MAIEINWGLLQPVDVGAAFQTGLANGQQMARQAAVESALRDYTAGGLDPSTANDPAMSERMRRAEGVLAAYAPDRLVTIDRIRSGRAQELVEQQARERRAAIFGKYGSDPAGARNDALAAVDMEALKVLDGLDEARKGQVIAGARLLEETNPTDQASYDRALQLARQGGIDVSNAPPEYNPEWIEGIKHLGRVASGPAKASEPTANIKDYEYARAQGYTGTFQQWQAENAGPVVVTNEDGTKTIIPRSALGGMASPSPARGGTTGGDASGIRAKNNPGALRKPGSMEFQTFPTEAAGIAAQERLLGRYHRRGLNTVSRVVETYAPRTSRGGDNTDEQVNNYTAYVAGRLGIDPNAPIPASMVPKLAEAMREFETGDRKPAKTQMASGGAPRVASKAEYDRLPSGTRFTAPDGSVRVKP